MADNNDGWIQVKHGKWANRVRSANGEAANDPGANKPLAVDPDVVAELQKEFQAIQADLEAYFPEAELRKIFADHILIFPNYVQDPVSKIVCFGIGCFDHPEGNWQAKRTSYCQLAALLVIADEVCKINGPPSLRLPCIQAVFE